MKRSTGRLQHFGRSLGFPIRHEMAMKPGQAAHAAPIPAGPSSLTDQSMRLSRYFLPILKENPREAEIVSHRLMLRAGMIRQQGQGS
ncbi:hypothetical protein, partial [Mesorhizobium sp. M8A.F.Ca.ET.213.01.1.1]|uniref:hypothetical protein n=1 Tax=Mesorhizobium sp. M8A.F.Ca.ET.213.01.1.1 TaxID=2563970 RepID=UPI0032AF493E